MGEICEVQLDKPYYYPGHKINGFVICNFNSQNKVRDIRIRFKGKADVYWREGKTNHSKEENYFDMVSPLLRSATTFKPGNYAYPFVYTLPEDLPASVSEQNVNIIYEVIATIDKPWAKNYTTKKKFFVYSHRNLNDMLSLKNPAVFTEEKAYLLAGNGVIKIVVKLPKTGYVPDEMISIVCSVRNNSSIKVDDVQFSFVQGYELIAGFSSKEILSLEGQPFAVANGTVLPFSEQTRDLQIRVPGNVYNGNIQHCKIMKTFWELRGEVFLPLMYTNLKIKVPITIGSVPLV